MKYEKEIDELLKDILFDDTMSEDFCVMFLFQNKERYNFIKGNAHKILLGLLQQELSLETALKYIRKEIKGGKYENWLCEGINTKSGSSKTINVVRRKRLRENLSRKSWIN
ncbi:hypothetical protein [Flammeovirga sp. SJP92]|uniref:hypothetical protein n=1 Tax=Flammeovirga sp. SJP92 TaxID=1775430 RepID=UPI00155FCC6B|nr:hypothetical protein [Flammeovirga sp. SJP92]